MPRVDLIVKVSVELEDIEPELLNVVGREIIADLSAGTLGHNQNVVELEIVDIDSTVTIKKEQNLMPDKELSELGQ